MEQEKPFREELTVGVKTAAMTSSFPGLEHHVCLGMERQMRGWKGSQEPKIWLVCAGGP